MVRTLSSAFVFSLVLGGSITALAQPFRPQPVALFNGVDTKGWVVNGLHATVADGVLRLSGAGWIRTERASGDNIFAFDMRLSGEHPAVEAIVRTRPIPKSPALRDTAYTVNMSSAPPPGQQAGSPSWHRVEITSIGRVVTLSVDGVEQMRDERLASPQGFMGFAVSQGVLELREISTKAVMPDIPRAEGEFVIGEVTAPRVTREVKPKYTREAMAAQIEGEVWMRVVVLPDGRVGAVRVLRSLDPDYGLDAEAIAAARQWRFTPGTRDGAPVSVVVTLELTFSLRK
jgi:TonB family protein